MTQKSLLVSGDASGVVRFTEVRDDNGKILARTQSEIQTLPGLKDVCLLKSRSKELRLVCLSASGLVQIFDSQGNLQVDINEQLRDLNEQRTKAGEPVPGVELPIQRIQLPGSSRLACNTQRSVCYVPAYGGGLVAISPSGRILAQEYLVDG